MSSLNEVSPGYDIVISNSQKWRKNKDGTPNYEDLREDLFCMVIINEAHHLPAKQWEDIIEKFRGHAKIVFITATLERYDRQEITTDGTLSTFKNGAYSYSRGEAVRDRLIRNVKFSELSHPPSKRFKAAQGGSDERRQHAREVLIEVKKLMNEKNEHNEQFPLPGGVQHASIVIAKDTADAKYVKNMCTRDPKLNFAADKVGLILSAALKNPKEREEEIKKIKSGQYKIVIIVGMLLEGFDYPQFSIAGIVTRIRSPVKFTQFVSKVRQVVRDNSEVENENIVGDVVTHKYFEQRKLYDAYKEPRIPEKENEDIDEDVAEQDENVPPAEKAEM